MKFVGGALCLDFVNTVGGWTPDGKVIADKIQGFEDLTRWADLAGILPPGGAASVNRLARKHPDAAANVLRRSIALRRSLHTVFLASIEGRKSNPNNAKVWFRELEIARGQYRIRQAGKTFEWHWEKSAKSLDSILWRVSASAAELLTSPELSRLRQCGGSNCGWMFLDVSRNHSRTWCDMKDCGNREKIRRFRERHEPPAKPGRR